MTSVYYINCSSCGYEAFDERVAYVRSVANGSVYECPSCNAETMNVDIEE